MKIHIIQHVAFEPAGMIIEWARGKNYELTHSLLFNEKSSWPAIGDFDMLVILGGPMGIDEEHRFEWLKAEKVFIKQAIAANKIILGICLGSQLLAEALGARVYPNQEKEIGFFPVTKTDEGKQDKVFSSIPETWNVFHWHSDTFDLPEGASHLFRSAACNHQVFRKGRCTGIQFHPEVNEDLLGSMVANEKYELIKANYIQSEDEILDTIIPEQNRIYLYEFLTRLERSTLTIDH